MKWWSITAAHYNVHSLWVLSLNSKSKGLCYRHCARVRKVKWGLWLSWHCCNQTWKHKLSATWANSCNSIRNVAKTILKWNFFKRVSGKESLSSRIDRVKAAKCPLTLSLSVTSNLMMTLEDGHVQDGVLEVDENQISPFALFSHENGYRATVKSLKRNWKRKLKRLNYLFF